MYTYEDVLLLAGELVATADLYSGKEDAMDLCLQAGKLRGLVAAGEPINSNQFATEIDEAFVIYATARKRYDTTRVS